MIEPARVESACWDTIEKWCLNGGQDLDIDYRTLRFSVEKDPEDGSPIPTYCAFKGDTVICGFNSDTRLQALVLAANWCQKEVARETARPNLDGVQPWDVTSKRLNRT